MPKTIPENAVWFVTGCSTGIGASLSKLLEQSTQYRIVATARRVSALSYLPEDSPNVLKLQLDVTSKTSIVAAVAAAVERFGRIDVLVNNAGYGIMGDSEFIPDTEARALMDTNFWGMVDTTKEVLRVFREVNPPGDGGVIMQVSSIGGFVGFPGGAYYHASKFAMEGFTESISKEMFPKWNIKFMIFEPGVVKTEFFSNLNTTKRHPAYASPSGPTSQVLGYIQTPGISNTWSDPLKVVETVVKVVESGDIPIRLRMGSDAWGASNEKVESLRKELDKWKEVSESSSAGEKLDWVQLANKQS